ncbi:MAG: hypothetical protein R3F03_03190 [Opitutaceae bacterium]
MTPPEEKPKLRVSDWTETPTAAAQSDPIPAPEKGSSNRPPVETEESGLDLPVDPFRLLGGLWQRRRWLAVGAFVGLVCFGVIGMWRTQTRHQVSAQLIKREVPDTFRAGEVGEAYKPRTLSTATLLGLASSANVLTRVAERSQPQVSLGLLRRSIEVAEQRGTDYLYLTLSGYESAQATVDLANVWAEEVVNYTREMQSRESREIRQYLQQELDAGAAELERVAQALLDYTQREGLVNLDKQIDAQLRAIGDLDLRYESARLEIEANDIKLRSLEAELSRQSPLADELKTARATLADLRTRYTDENPIVREALDRVAQVEARLADAQEEKGGDLSRFAGTFLGNTLYLQILELRSQREALAQNLEGLAVLREKARAELNALPAKEMGIAQLTRQKTSLENTRSLLLSRLREAEVFEQRPPGYYQIFAPATIDTVITKPKSIKVVVYGGAGLVLGLGLAFMLALGMELIDSKLRTGTEAAKAWSAPLLASLPAAPPADPTELEDTITQLWSRWLGAADAGRRVQIIWSPQYDESENALWALLVTEAKRLKPNLLIVDTGAIDQRPPALSQLSAVSMDELDRNARGAPRLDLDPTTLSLPDATSLALQLQRLAAKRPVWLRLVGTVREPLSTLARGAAAPLIIVPAGLYSIPFWRDQAGRLRATGLKPAGVVTLRETPWHER